jgi:hypothetical protein
MGFKTPDDFEGKRLETETLYAPNATPDGGAGSESYDGTSFVMEDAAGLFDPRPDGKVAVNGADALREWLADKIQSADLSVGIAVVDKGSGILAIDFNVDVGETLQLQEIESQVPLTTSLTTEQDLFAGLSLPVLKDGDYLAILETSSAGTSSANEMAISVGLDGLNTVAGSERQGIGNDRRSLVSVKKLVGLTTANTIHGTFRKVGGSGSAGVFERSLTAFLMG